MLMSKLLGERYKEAPADATSDSHIFLLRGGYIRQVSNGIFSMLMPAKRVAKKIENIIREEMDKIEGQEVLFPVVLPAELWQESGRYESVGSELLRLKDRAGHPMLLGMTHEEAAVHLARTEALTYAKYPFMIYQIQTKFRDEPRSRGGLIRVREFTMKDAYSFHTSQESLEEYYEECLKAYHTIFERVGLPQVISVGSDTGMMGGKIAHEFMLLTDIGEDTIVVCDNCSYKANMEVATSTIIHEETKEEEPLKVYTPNIKEINLLAKFFNVSENRILKSIVFEVENSNRPLIVFIRGDLEVNESKVKSLIKANILPYSKYEDSTLVFGYIGPYGLHEDEVQIIFDKSLIDENNLICGANEIDHHIKGFSVTRDLSKVEFHDVAKVNENDNCPKCGGNLKLKRGVEVGNIFQLGTKYTKAMNMTYIDRDGQSKNPIMGCYGIGVGRLLACIIEANRDSNGPIWPKSVAPWQIHICVIKSQKVDMDSVGQDIYNRLKNQYEVIMDDRNVVAGVQFADADLLGVPLRIIVSERNIKTNQLEITTRDKKIKKIIKVEDLEREIEEILNM
ncbi:proline--tRNA ligase [Clostridium argentinense CDC 2741]|uniref:Proline--tRNA ligase n=2 Tax=Clostridium argentinense TaxID=29341 RepID=A0A0C1TZQ1_9CLOT|nr:proline--tRNA ligase [Clostridium argentinense]ARC85034.1 proline--tRNA ligase [Clostridium argentinense]KIE46089.1 proline--tRNA ligase [Clostridium argentinense CDC 2741]NFF40435.1 proline--tRNA ligase [Clostridium argentinense]NFP50510.1 proline--tRNA ligase [Clostridium argentinense]NFP72884.1 proline--tRNA ligase [Clostridium argentinense]